MANEFLELFIKLNLAASAAIIAVMVFRKPVRRLAGARAAYGLWICVPIIAAAAFLPARQIDVLATDLMTRAAGSGPVEGPIGILTAGKLDPTLWLILLWAAGALIALSYVRARHLKFLRRLGRLTARQPGVVQAEREGVGPAVFGLASPRIVVPADFDARFDPEERRLILAHEARHLAAGHAQANAFVVLAQCLGWFNPLIHVAGYTFRIDQELACDAAVLERHPDRQLTYARAMLKTQVAEAPLLIGCYWPSRSANPLTERVAMLRRTRVGVARRMAGAGALVALAASGGFSAWAAQPPRLISAEQSVEASRSITEASTNEAPLPATTVAARRSPEPALAVDTANIYARVSAPAPLPIETPPPAVDTEAPRAASPVPQIATASDFSIDLESLRRPPSRPQDPSVSERPQLQSALYEQLAPDPDAVRPADLGPAEIVFLQRPSRADLARAFPGIAVRAGQSGFATLECIIDRSGHLADCTASATGPIAKYFAEAAMTLAPEFRVNPTAPDGRSVVGTRVAVPVTFRFARW